MMMSEINNISTFIFRILTVTIVTDFDQKVFQHLNVHDMKTLENKLVSKLADKVGFM